MYYMVHQYQQKNTDMQVCIYEKNIMLNIKYISMYMYIMLCSPHHNVGKGR